MVNFSGISLRDVAVAKYLIVRETPGSIMMVIIGSISGAVVGVPQPQAPVRRLAAFLAVKWDNHSTRVHCIGPVHADRLVIFLLTILCWQMLMRFGPRQIVEEMREIREKKHL